MCKQMLSCRSAGEKTQEYKPSDVTVNAERQNIVTCTRQRTTVNRNTWVHLDKQTQVIHCTANPNTLKLKHKCQIFLSMKLRTAHTHLQSYRQLRLSHRKGEDIRTMSFTMWMLLDHLLCSLMCLRRAEHFLLLDNIKAKNTSLLEWRQKQAFLCYRVKINSQVTQTFLTDLDFSTNESMFHSESVENEL